MKLRNSPAFRQNPLKKCEVPVMEQAIQAYHKITADSEFRERERLHELARHNEATALRHARDKAKAEGEEKKALEIARKMKKAGRPLSEIMEFTGLPAESI